MKKLALVLLLALTITGVALTKGMTNPPLNARECKMLLAPGRFQNRDAGTQQFVDLLTALCKKQGIKATFQLYEEGSPRLVSFLDTPGLELYPKSFILRRRQYAEIEKHVKVKKANDKFELTMKFRNLDPTVVIAAEILPAPGYKSKVSFEEKVLIRDTSIDKVYDYSAKVTLDKKPGDTLQDYATVYPGLQKTGVSPSSKIKRVNDIKVVEYSREIGTIDFTRGVFATVEMAVWYKEGESKPLIAEFSYKYKLKGGEPTNTTIYSSGQKSDDFGAALQKAAKDWIAVGVSKTGLIYQISGPDQD